MHYKDLYYDSYDDYLNGSEWEELHEYFYQHCGSYECGICGVRRYLRLHKRTYEHLTLDSLRKRFILDYFVTRWLKKHFVWLCKNCNEMVHFYDNGAKVPLQYDYLMRRERQVIRERRSIIRKIMQARPSEVLGALGRFLQWLWREYQI